MDKYKFSRTVVVLCIAALFVNFTRGEKSHNATRTDLTECKLTHFGTEYQGQKGTTGGGIRCQFWHTEDPMHKISSDIKDNDFPERSMRLAKNYCRNPTRDPKGPWCYTMEPMLIDDECGIPLCNYGECRISGTGAEYGGSKKISVAGKKCKSWDKRHKLAEGRTEKFSSKKFPELSRTKAGTFCRNPNDDIGGPWCYVEEENFETVEKEHCDIPFCDDKDCLVYVRNTSVYSTLTKLNETYGNITLWVKLWNPMDQQNAEARLLLSLLPVPTSAKRIAQDWRAGVEILLSNAGSGQVYPTSEDEQDFESTPNIILGTKWSGIWINWGGGFISVGLYGSTKPLFMDEYKKKKTISSLYPDSFLYYGLMGTGVLWSTEFCQDACEVHTTFGMEYLRVWPLQPSNTTYDVRFNVRASKDIAIRLYQSPGLLYPCFTLTIGHADTITVIYEESEKSTKQHLKDAPGKSLLDFWTWKDFTLSIFGPHLRLFSERIYGSEEILYLKENLFGTIRWFSVGSKNNIAMWTFFCTPETDPVESPSPPNCITNLADYTYEGSQWTSVNEMPCTPWTSPEIPDDDQKDDSFVEGKALKALNKCRNPGHDPNGPYCYSLSLENSLTASKQYCPIRSCRSSECRMAGTGNDYVGTLSVTRSGRTCAEWMNDYDLARLEGEIDAQGNATRITKTTTTKSTTSTPSTTIATTTISTPSTTKPTTTKSTTKTTTTPSTTETTTTLRTTEMTTTPSTTETTTVPSTTETTTTPSTTESTTIPSTTETTTTPSPPETTTTPRITETRTTSITTESTTTPNTTETTIIPSDTETTTLSEIEITTIPSESETTTPSETETSTTPNETETTTIPSETETTTTPNTTKRITAPSTTKTTSTPSTSKITTPPSTSKTITAPSTTETPSTQSRSKIITTPSTTKTTSTQSRSKTIITPSTTKTTSTQSKTETTITSSTTKTTTTPGTTKTRSTPSTTKTTNTPSTIKTSTVPSRGKTTNTPSTTKTSRTTSTTKTASTESGSKAITTPSTMKTTSAQSTTETITTPSTTKTTTIPGTSKTITTPSTTKTMSTPTTTRTTSAPSTTSTRKTWRVQDFLSRHQSNVSITFAPFKEDWLSKLNADTNKSKQTRTTAPSTTKTASIPSTRKMWRVQDFLNRQSNVPITFAPLKDNWEKKLQTIRPVGRQGRKSLKPIHSVNPEFFNDTLYPEHSVRNASNYCRDPSRNIAGTWCYTTDPLVPQDLCDVRDCDMPEECTFLVRGQGVGRRLYVLPEHRAEGLHFSLKAWEPDQPDSITFVFTADDGLKSRYILKVGAVDNEKVILYHQGEEGDIKLVKKKTLPHLLYLGKWSSFVIKIPRGQVLVYYQGAPNPLFQWDHPEPAKAFLPIYYYYTSELGHTIGVAFDCATRCHIENTRTEKFSRILPLSIWSKSSLSSPKKLQLMIRAKGVVLIPLLLFPGTPGYYAITLGELGQWVFFLKNTYPNVRIYHKQKAPATIFTPDSWTNITMMWFNSTIDVLWNGTLVFHYEHTHPLLFYYFSLGVDPGGWATWAANCIPSDIDGDPEDGGWSEWGPWACSASCNGGVGTRKRVCNNPEPNIKGEPCLGPNIMSGRCNTIACGDITEDTVNLIKRRIRRNHTSLSVKEGQEITIPADPDIIKAITTESPDSEIEWSQNGIFVYPDNDRLEIEEHNVVIKRARMNDSGVYTITLHRVDGTHMIFKMATLVVYPVKSVITLRETLPMTVTCHCIILGYLYSDLKISWSIEENLWKSYGTTLPISVNVDIVPALNSSHKGLWECVVEQDDLGFKWTTNAILVNVIGPPNWRTHLMEDDLTKPIFGWMPNETFVAVSALIIFLILTLCIIVGTGLYMRFRESGKYRDPTKKGESIVSEKAKIAKSSLRTSELKTIGTQHEQEESNDETGIKSPKTRRKSTRFSIDENSERRKLMDDSDTDESP